MTSLHCLCLANCAHLEDQRLQLRSGIIINKVPALAIYGFFPTKLPLQTVLFLVLLIFQMVSIKNPCQASNLENVTSYIDLNMEEAE